MISLRDVVTGFGNRDPLAEIWRRDLRGGGGGGSAVITGVPPLRFIGYGRPLTDYLLSGNTIQDGTPSPEDPVDAAGCGEWDEAHQSYKLPLTVNGTEYPIYLGQVETTRRIRQRVLTGKENFVNNYGTHLFTWSNFGRLVMDKSSLICSNAVFNPVQSGLNNALKDGEFAFQYAYGSIGFKDERFSTPAAFKSYLAAQYAAGTPVTVWYVLAEPETAVVNEPLMKIGDYADTVSFAQAGVTIPTVSGENVLDVPTDVKPSEVTIKGGISSV